MKTLVHIKCQCGNILDLIGDNDWDINIVGLMQFRCARCHNIHTTPGLLEEEEDDDEIGEFRIGKEYRN